MAAIRGRTSAALSVPNGSVFLSQEFDLCPEDGEQDLYFERRAADGPACIVLRNFGEARSQGCLISVQLGQTSDLRAGQAITLAGPAAAVDASGLTLAHSNIAYTHEPMWPISLGNTCEAKLQLCRALQFRHRSDISSGAFRLLMSPPDRSRLIFGWDVFDWQGTPLNTLFHYFSHDFSGLYEREDLITNGFNVLNRRTGAEHRHDYEVLKPSHEPMTDELIDRGYEAARARFEAMAARFRSRLCKPGPYLYVHTCDDIPSEYRTRLLLRQLASRSPDHRFHLLIVGYEDEDHDLSNLSSQVTKAYRPRPPSNANAFDWAADYPAWDTALAPFNLLLPIEDSEEDRLHQSSLGVNVSARR